MAGFPPYGLPSDDVETDGDFEIEPRVPMFGLHPHKTDNHGRSSSRDTDFGKQDGDRIDSVFDSGFSSVAEQSLYSQRDSGLELGLDSLHLAEHRAPEPPNITRTPTTVSHIKQERDSGLVEETISGVDEAYNSVPNKAEAPPREHLDLYIQDDDGDSKLHLAIIHSQSEHSQSEVRQSEVTQHIIELCPSSEHLSLQNALRQTPLHLAVLTNQPHIVRKLMVWGADIVVRDRHGNTPLHLACQRGFVGCIKCLTTPLSDEETSTVLISTPTQCIPQDLDIKNYEGKSCLHVTLQAPKESQNNILYYLLRQCSADVNTLEGKCGRTLLHEAVDANDLELTKFLLAQPGIRVDARTYGGYTPLRLASSRGYQQATQMLLDMGADQLELSLDDYYSSDSDDESMDGISYDDKDFCIGGQPISI